MKPIRFYHWWAYKLYEYLWNPILRERPHMAKAMADYVYEYLDEHE